MWALLAAIVTAAGALSGTWWTKRRTGPDMTATVLGSVGDHVRRLDADIARLTEELAAMRERLHQVEDELLRERDWSALLVVELRKSGLDVPNQPTGDDDD